MTRLGLIRRKTKPANQPTNQPTKRVCMTVEEKGSTKNLAKKLNCDHSTKCWYRRMQPLPISLFVTLRRWSAKQTIPLTVLARNQTKAWARDLDATGSRKGTPVEVGKRNSKKAVGKEWPVDTGEQKWPVRMRESPVPVKEDRSRWVGIPSSFVEISLEIHASVSLHMHKGNATLHNTSLAPWVNPSIFFVCSFSSHSLDCISCCYEEMCDTLSEPLVDHRPRSEMFEEVDVSGAEWVSSHIVIWLLRWWRSASGKDTRPGRIPAA